MDALLLLLYLYVLSIGICTTSFLNVVIWRLPQGLSLVKGRPHRPSCYYKLQWYDLFPVFSYLFLKGKCRYCGNKILAHETVLEFLGSCTEMFCFYTHGFSWDAVLVFAVFMILFTTTMIDSDIMTIPSGLVISLIVPIGILTVLHPGTVLMARVIGFFIVSLPMYLLTLLTLDCFGGGDIKLTVVADLPLGWKLTLLALLISVPIGGSYAAYLLLSRKTQERVYIAFGLHLRAGTMIPLLYGETLTQGYPPLFEL